tara:strand:- start:2563 stop:3027 length:465 start_codon:yes stop_codon:yes gene_type:complete
MKTFIDYHNLREEVEPVPVKKEPDSISLNIGGTDYKLEVADKPDKIYKGMSGRKSIPRKTGMLFDMPSEDKQSFCMRDCMCNMDLVYANKKGEIKGLHRMTAERPKRKTETDIQYNKRLKNYDSDGPAKYAIELPAGDITRLGLKQNQIINIPK